MAWPQMAGAAVAAHALLAALLLAAHPAAAMGGFGGGMGSTKEPKAPAVKEDLKYIKCQVCEKAVKLAMANVGDLRAKAAAKPGSKVGVVCRQAALGAQRAQGAPCKRGGAHGAAPS